MKNFELTLLVIKDRTTRQMVKVFAASAINEAIAQAKTKASFGGLQVVICGWRIAQ